MNRNLAAVLVLASVLVSGFLFLQGPGGDDGRKQADVFLVVTEATRADHVGPCYGYDRATAPNLCGMAEDAVLFEHAYSQGTETVVSMPSLMTGRPPNAVGLPGWEVTLSDTVTTVGERLAGAGYTAVAHDHEQNITGATFANLDQGMRLSPPLAGMEEIPESPLFSLSFIREQAHLPYSPSSGFMMWADPQNMSEIRQSWPGEVVGSEGRQTIVGLYDGEIREADSEIGSLVERLKEEGRYRDSMIIVTSDHGELLGETRWPDRRERFGQHNGTPAWTHEGPPEMGLVHVPLIVKFPGNRFAGRRISTPVRHVDLVPTISDTVGLSLPEGTVGRSLIRIIQGSSGGIPFSSEKPESGWAAWNRSHALFVERPGDYCEDGNAGGASLYRRNGSVLWGEVVPGGAERGGPIHREMCGVYRRGSEAEVNPVNATADYSEEVKERLREMGYLR